MSHPTTYNAMVVLPEPTDQELGFLRATAVRTFGHNLEDGRMMAGMGDLFAPTGALAAAVFHAKGVPPRLREFILLRTAKLMNCPFPWAPNVRLAANAGVTPAEIDALEADGPVTGLDAEGTLIVRAVDEITRTGTLTDGTLTALRARYTDEMCRKYVLIMSWANLFTRFCNGCRVAVESPAEAAKTIGHRTAAV